jgi:hypothetical protein
VRYHELLREATEQFWAHAWNRFKYLQENVAADPEGTLAECEALIRTLNSMTPEDANEGEAIEIAVECADDLIAEAQRIINQQS